MPISRSCVMASLSFWLRCTARSFTRRISSSGNSRVVFTPPYFHIPKFCRDTRQCAGYGFCRNRIRIQFYINDINTFIYRRNRPDIRRFSQRSVRLDIEQVESPCLKMVNRRAARQPTRCTASTHSRGRALDVFRRCNPDRQRDRRAVASQPPQTRTAAVITRDASTGPLQLQPAGTRTEAPDRAAARLRPACLRRPPWPHTARCRPDSAGWRRPC